MGGKFSGIPTGSPRPEWDASTRKDAERPQRGPSLKPDCVIKSGRSLDRRDLVSSRAEKLDQPFLTRQMQRAHPDEGAALLQQRERRIAHAVVALHRDVALEV